MLSTAEYSGPGASARHASGPRLENLGDSMKAKEFGSSCPTLVASGNAGKSAVGF
jgi:hypothetical protein